MLTLLIESSTERGLIALIENSKILVCKDLPYGYQNSTFLMPVIEECFRDTGVTASQLSMVAVAVGPGSYTGIRVGAIVAKSIAYACRLPLVGICTLEGFVPIALGSFAAIIDAKIGGVYILKGIRHKDSIVYTSQPAVCELRDLEKQLQGIEVLVTPNKSRLEPLLLGFYPEGKWKWREMEPNVEQLIFLAMRKYETGEYSKEGNLDLMYLRKTQAEIERDRDGAAC